MANPLINFATRELHAKDPWEWGLSHFRTFGQLISGETARGGAVLARAYMETLLEEYLLHLALSDRERRQKITTAIGRNLDSMIRYCHQLPLDKSVLEKMRLVKEIGDRFAHYPLLTSPKDDSVAMDLFTQLYRESYADGAFKPEESNRLLEAALTFVIGHLGGWDEQMKHIMS
jgi:hypothetical protein